MYDEDDNREPTGEELRKQKLREINRTYTQEQVGEVSLNLIGADGPVDMSRKHGRGNGPVINNSDPDDYNGADVYVHIDPSAVSFESILAAILSCEQFDFLELKQSKIGKFRVFGKNVDLHFPTDEDNDPEREIEKEQAEAAQAKEAFQSHLQVEKNKVALNYGNEYANMMDYDYKEMPKREMLEQQFSKESEIFEGMQKDDLEREASYLFKPQTTLIKSLVLKQQRYPTLDTSGWQAPRDYMVGSDNERAQVIGADPGQVVATDIIKETGPINDVDGDPYSKPTVATDVSLDSRDGQAILDLNLNSENKMKSAQTGTFGGSSIKERGKLDKQQNNLEDDSNTDPIFGNKEDTEAELKIIGASSTDPNATKEAAPATFIPSLESVEEMENIKMNMANETK
eukprot:CAMPEP_0115002064 /NCGR_PEP_ID=MMETSP0216-20121206/17781_1 /TAXON_ID=223996 /ORGANISM="Protocruzia adherens, Strain Boccale" /LENGTH=399 /DNA_ID=CAMNT_0002367583 /DNA_START=340 /DNA_END=1537 /DNA_ORIENTATION=-